MNVNFKIVDAKENEVHPNIFERLTIFQKYEKGKDATYIFETYDEGDYDFARTIIYALAALSLVSEYIYARSTYKVDLLTKQEDLKQLLRDYYEVDTHEELLALLKLHVEELDVGRKITDEGKKKK